MMVRLAEEIGWNLLCCDNWTESEKEKFNVAARRRGSPRVSGSSLLRDSNSHTFIRAQGESERKAYDKNPQLITTLRGRTRNWAN